MKKFKRKTLAKPKYFLYDIQFFVQLIYLTVNAIEHWKNPHLLSLPKTMLEENYHFFGLPQHKEKHHKNDNCKKKNDNIRVVKNMRDNEFFILITMLQPLKTSGHSWKQKTELKA